MISPMATLLSCVTTRIRILCNMNLIILSVCFKFKEYKLHLQCFSSFFLSIYIEISIFTTGNCFFVSKRLQINILYTPLFYNLCGFITHL